MLKQSLILNGRLCVALDRFRQRNIESTRTTYSGNIQHDEITVKTDEFAVCVMSDIDYSAAQNVVYRFKIHVKRKRRVSVRVARKYIVYTERFGTRRSGYRVLYRIDKVNHFHKIINHTRLEFFRRYRYVVTAGIILFNVRQLSAFKIQSPVKSRLLTIETAAFSTILIRVQRVTFYRNRIAYFIEE